MRNDEILPMAPLAPIVDQMRELATEELPAPRTCRVRLHDDGTFDAVIYHSMGKDERQQIQYVRTTGEIIWEYANGMHYETESVTENEAIHRPVCEETDVRVLATVEPPYR